ncbi:MAG TPA: lipoate protein ligase C-terminal domain-containing protein, partial [Bacteroidales bacterium]|nr:lipoate protein ligase C-terminal domain-containing protein [Bacteroidales bacterium]
HEKIQKMVEEKYGTWHWNYGYSPKYTYRKILRTSSSGTIEFALDVNNGIIKSVKIFGDYFNKYPTEDIENALQDIPHKAELIREALAPFNIGDYFNNLELDVFMEGFFN